MASVTEKQQTVELKNFNGIVPTLYHNDLCMKPILYFFFFFFFFFLQFGVLKWPHLQLRKTAHNMKLSIIQLLLDWFWSIVHVCQNDSPNELF